MRDELLAYLLNDLDDEQRDRIEARLDADPMWQHELERLRSYVQESSETETADDAENLPTDLVSRTCDFVQQASSQGSLSPGVLPPKLSESKDASGPRKNRWTLIDWGVVACILAVIGTLLVPAIRESRESARRLQCQEKLKTLGNTLHRFASLNNDRLPTIQQHENAGMFAVKLLESGVVSAEQLHTSLLCPSDAIVDGQSAEADHRIPTQSELQQAALAQLEQMLQRMGGSFAYRIGYYDQDGDYRQVKFTYSSSEPMMADKPSYEVAGFQSQHHGTCGQNVLFQDGSVRYMRICVQPGADKHWFLNEDKQHAAGTQRSDVVMGRSEASPSGKITLIENKRRQPVSTKP